MFSSGNILRTLSKVKPSLPYNQKAFISNDEFLKRNEGLYYPDQLEFYKKYEDRYKPLEVLMNQLQQKDNIQEPQQLRFIYSSESLQELIDGKISSENLSEDLFEPTIDAAIEYQSFLSELKENWADECGSDRQKLAEIMTGLRTFEIVTTRAVCMECLNGGVKITNDINAMQLNDQGSILGGNRIKELKELIKSDPEKLIEKALTKRSLPDLKKDLEKSTNAQKSCTNEVINSSEEDTTNFQKKF